MSLVTIRGNLKKSIYRGCAFIALVALSACTNLPGRRVIAGFTNPTELPGTGSSSFINLLRVLKSAHAPQSEFDLLGDGTGQIGRYCVGVGGEASCQCRFKYVTPAGAQETLDVDPTYSEADLLRCSYSEIQSGVSTIDVSIHFIEANKFSNTFSYSFPGGGSLPGGGDPTAIATFIEPMRYQCRDVVYIPYLFERLDRPSGSKIYDPFQSENSRLTYPLNFYTSNLARAIGLYSNIVQPGGSGVENGPEANAYYDCALNAKSLPGWANLRIYSLAPDPSGSHEIFPGTSEAINRSKFLLARDATGVFNKPVNGRFAPPSETQPAGLFTRYTPPGQNPPANTLPPLGYAAAPIGEACPNIPIPAGHRWVKVWQFQAALPNRTYVYDSKKIDETRAIFCDPGTASDGFSRLGPPEVLRPHAAIPDCSFHAGGRGNPVRTVNSAAATAAILPAVPAATDDQGFIPSRAGDRDFVLEESLSPRAIPKNGATGYVCFDFARNGAINDEAAERAQPLFENHLSGFFNLVGPIDPDPNNWQNTLPLRVPYKGIAGGFNLSGGIGQAYRGADSWVRVGSGVPSHDAQPNYPYHPGALLAGQGAPYDSTDELQAHIPFGLKNHPVWSLFDMHLQNTNAAPPPPPPPGAMNLSRAIAGLSEDKHGTTGIPHDSELLTSNLDGVARFDYLLVASPPSITINQMRNRESAAAPYIPFRYKTNEDCTLAEPSTCGENNRIGYDVELHEANGSSGGSGAQVFPVCAIQPI
jgi:hypothetical protein